MPDARNKAGVAYVAGLAGVPMMYMDPEERQAFARGIKDAKAGVEECLNASPEEAKALIFWPPVKVKPVSPGPLKCSFCHSEGTIMAANWHSWKCARCQRWNLPKREEQL